MERSKNPNSLPIFYGQDGCPVWLLGPDEHGQRVAMDERGVVVTLGSGETLYGSPDAGMRHAIEQLDHQKAELRDGIELLAATLDTAERTHEARLKELARLNPALAEIESFLRGEFTHFAFIPEYGSVRVWTRDEALKTDDWGGSLRMVSLSGSVASGRLTWEINKYHDGSGQDTTVVPCKSEEEARGVARREIIERLKGDDWRHWLTEADRFGVEVPRDKRVRYAADTLKAAEEEYLAAQQQSGRALAKREEARELARKLGSQP